MVRGKNVRNKIVGRFKMFRIGLSINSAAYIQYFCLVFEHRGI